MPRQNSSALVGGGLLGMRVFWRGDKNVPVDEMTQTA